MIRDTYRNLFLAEEGSHKFGIDEVAICGRVIKEAALMGKNASVPSFSTCLAKQQA